MSSIGIVETVIISLLSYGYIFWCDQLWSASMHVRKILLAESRENIGLPFSHWTMDHFAITSYIDTVRPPTRLMFLRFLLKHKRKPTLRDFQCDLDQLRARFQLPK